MELEYKATKKLSEGAVEKACSSMGLQLTMKGSLKSLASNIHWHYKKARQPGVLEITLMMNENKLILTCKKNRNGEWIGRATDELKAALKLTEIPN